jgi:hypothetical protein
MAITILQNISAVYNSANEAGNLNLPAAGSDRLFLLFATYAGTGIDLINGSLSPSLCKSDNRAAPPKFKGVNFTLLATNKTTALTYQAPRTTEIWYLKESEIVTSLAASGYTNGAVDGVGSPTSFFDCGWQSTTGSTIDNAYAGGNALLATTTLAGVDQTSPLLQATGANATRPSGSSYVSSALTSIGGGLLIDFIQAQTGGSVTTTGATFSFATAKPSSGSFSTVFALTSEASTTLPIVTSTFAGSIPYQPLSVSLNPASAVVDTTPPVLSSIVSTPLDVSTTTTGISNEGGQVSCVVTNQAASVPPNTGVGSFDNSTFRSNTVVADQQWSIQTTGLTANTPYKVWVQAKDAAGNRSTVVSYNFTTQAALPIAAVISTVIGARGTNVVSATETFSIIVDNSANITSVSLGGIVLTNVVIVNGTTVTATLPRGGLPFGSLQSLIVNNGINSLPFPVTFQPPTGFNYVTLTSDYASLPDYSIFYNVGVDLDLLQAGDQVAYSSLISGYSVQIDSVGGVTVFNAPSGEYQGSYYILEQSDNYSASDSNQSFIITGTAVVDVTPPIFTSNPAIVTTAYNSVSTSCTISENGDISLVVVANNAAAPSNATFDASVNRITTSGGISAVLTATSLSALTSYDFYYQAKDTAGNRSANVKLDVATVAAPDTTPPAYVVSPLIASTTTTATLSGTVDENGFISFIIKPDEGLNVTQPLNSEFNAAELAVSANVAFTVLKTALMASTAYDGWVRIRDVAGNQTIQKIDFTTQATVVQTPTAFTFTDHYLEVISNPITVAGLTAQATISVGGDVSTSYSTDDGVTWSKSPSLVSNGQIVRIKHLSRMNYITTSVITIGTYSTSFISDATDQVGGGVVSYSTSFTLNKRIPF